MNNSCLLYFEPFVYITLKNKKVLIYNTLNGKRLEISNVKIMSFLRGINLTKNKYSKEFSSKYLQDKEFFNFIIDIRKYYMGDILKAKEYFGRPFQYPLNIRIENSIESLKLSKENKSISRNLFMNLREVTIYLNSECTLSCSICRNCFKQMTYCTKFQDSNGDIPIHLLQKLFKELQKEKLTKINLVGGCILLFSNIIQLRTVLSRFSEICEFNIFYKNIILYQDILKNLDFNIHVNIDFDNSATESAVNETFKIISQYSSKFRFTFVIQDESDLNITDIDLLKKHLVNVTLRPYFNNSNFQFFKKNVFIRKNDLFNNRPSMKQIAVNRILNQNDFGKITILCNGDIYSNLNNSIIGNIENITIEEAISNEMSSKTSWFKTREHLNPCNKCIYNLLCPPTSNFEYIFKRNDLCTIRENTNKKKV